MDVLTGGLRVFHSFWSKPLLQKRFGVSIDKQIVSTILFTAIGVAFAKRMGVEIVLHTDGFGAKLFEGFPYDEVFLTLDGHDINRQFWASGKMAALAAEPLGSCHLDLDAWIKFPQCRDILLESGADIVVQSVEDSADVYGGIKDFVFGNIDDPGFIDLKASDNHMAYNCGLVKINSQRLKDLYLKSYWEITNQLNGKELPGIEDRYCIPDLISEQWLLYQLCKQNNYSVECLCDGWVDQRRAKSIGFTHLISEQKYHIDEQLENVLLELDGGLHRIAVERIKNQTDSLAENRKAT